MGEQRESVENRRGRVGHKNHLPISHGLCPPTSLPWCVGSGPVLGLVSGTLHSLWPVPCRGSALVRAHYAIRIVCREYDPSTRNLQCDTPSTLPLPHSVPVLSPPLHHTHPRPPHTHTHTHTYQGCPNPPLPTCPCTS